MTTYIKKAAKTPETDEAETRVIVQKLLKGIQENGEDDYIRHYGAKFGESWPGNFILTQEDIEERIAEVPARIKEDIQFAYDQVYGFALKQRESMKEFEDLSGGFPGAVAYSLQLRRMLCAGR